MAGSGSRPYEGMIFTVASTFEYLSEGMTLRPGDVIWSGTPHGVAAGMGSPDAFLSEGDVMHCKIASLGARRTRTAHLRTHYRWRAGHAGQYGQPGHTDEHAAAHRHDPVRCLFMLRRESH